MKDLSEAIRRARQAFINATPASRQELENLYGQVWDTDELSRDFEVIHFLAPYVAVRRRSDGVKGTLEFQHNPRLYWRFVPHRE